MKTKFNGILTLLLAFVVQISFAQEKTITGTVVDETNMPLPGATVLIKGTTTGASTDFDGKYSISANTGDVLTFSYVGYADQNITVGASNKIDVSLALDSSLDEVVVTALGIKRKSDAITTANQVVKTAELTQANNPDVIAGLSGKVSGLQVNTLSNGVNGNTQIVLRGFRSISGNNEALVVIDGVVSTANVLKSIDSDQIASINVIKGANGAALYGQEGSNGVIIAETKSGAGKGKDKGRVSLQVKSSLDFEEVAFLPQRQDRFGQGWDIGNGVFENVTYENGGWGPEYDGAPVTIGLPQADGNYITAPFSPIEDNIKDFFKTGTTYQNSIALAMGDSESFMNISAKKQDIEFVIPNDELTRTSVLFKGGKKLGKWNLQTNVSYAREKRSAAATGLYTDLLQTPTNVPVGQFENSGNEGHWNGYYLNPYWLRDNNRGESQRDRYVLGASLTYKINDNINVLLRPNLNNFVSNGLSYTGAYSDPQSVIDITGNTNRNQVSSFRRFISNSSRFSNDIMVNFDYTLTQDIGLKANLGNNVTTLRSNFNSIGGDNLIIPGLYTASNVTLAAAGDGTSPTVGSYFDEERNIGVYGQLDLDYKDFLFLNFTARNDWTSVLALENNSFFYPSAGFSFIPTKAFPSIKGNILNSAKITGSIVQVGSKGGTDPYDTFATFNVGSGYPFANGPSFVNDTTITDPNLEPEFTTSTEFGVNLDFLKSRVTLDAAYYNFTTDNQIIGVGASSASGVANNTVNLSEVKGNGFEIDLGLTPLKTDDLEWNLRLSYSTARNEVVKVSDETDEVVIGQLNSVGSFAVEGEQFPLIKGTAWEKDPQGRVIIDPATGLPTESTEFQVLGQATPDYILGLNTTLKYKNLRFGATLDYRTGHQFYAETRSWLTWSGHLEESAQGGRNPFVYPNSSIEVSPGVYEANTNVVTGGPNAGSLINFYGQEQNIAENHVLDATALKLRELSLSYSLSKKMLKNTPIQDLTLGLNARNLYTWLPAENRGYGDPEFAASTGNAGGIQTLGQYPPTRTYGFSINLTF